ncbi:Uncharacterised protein [Candidatus Bilamarchaeum dharawalense]|uniref:Uncharacterized protein n=1 Tax=Candidatus Bilamarchaeum dharawalense TaxID=2885759 RepID=A0A5E4LQL1_9ARCH|nr:Uncharacterised protein [Candidatus Bilamarchaeum dharawalense]
MSESQTTSRVGALKEKFTPPPYTLFRKYKELRAEGQSRLDALNELHVGSYLLKVAASLAINRLTARAFGYGAWDPSFSGQVENRLKDSSSLCLTVSTSVASAVPSHYADYLTAIEVALCVPRILIEQKAFSKLGITPDPLGPILTPYTVGVLEMGYKLMERQPKDPATQVITAITGIFGNLVRMAEAGLLIGLAAVYQRQAQPKPD